jgi:hypothetical protein
MAGPLARATGSRGGYPRPAYDSEQVTVSSQSELTRPPATKESPRTPGGFQGGPARIRTWDRRIMSPLL